MTFPNIAEFEETDSRLAIKTILELHAKIDKLEHLINLISKTFKENAGHFEDGCPCSIIEDLVEEFEKENN